MYTRTETKLDLYQAGRIKWAKSNWIYSILFSIHFVLICIIKYK